MIVEQKNDALTIRKSDFTTTEKMNLLLISDIHIDSKKCDRKLLIRHLDEAKQRDAGIMIFGDLFDCMGGKYDKRTNKQDLRPEYQVANYFDAITSDAAKILKPYAENIIMISEGNHEISVTGRHEINLIHNLINQLNPKIHHGSYAGFVKFILSKNNGNGMRKSYTMYYTHGNGGNAPSSRGVLSTGRRQEAFEADLYVSGHNHNGWEMTRPKVFLNDACNIQVNEPVHMNLGTYKNDILDGGYADMKGFQPPVIGGYWLTFYIRRDKYGFKTVRAKD